MVDNSSAESAQSDSARSYTQEDLQAGARVVRFALWCVSIALIAVLIMAVYTFLNVPWETRLDYSGRYGRDGLPMQVVLMAAPVMFCIMLWQMRKPSAGRMGKSSRVIGIFGTIAFVIFGLWGQWYLAHELLVAGGALSS